MAPIVSFALMAATIMGAMSAPVSTETASIKYTGFSKIYNDFSIRNACPDIKYSVNDAFAAVSAIQFGDADDGLSLCGKYVKINRADTPDEHFMYKIVDLCKHCDDNEIDLSESAIREMTNSDRVKVDWEIVDGDNEEDKKAKNSKLAVKKEIEDDNNDHEDHYKGHKGTTYHGRGTWFSDTMGSCGKRFSQEDMIVALNEAQMGKMWGSGSKCGAKIRVSVKGSSKSVVVRVVDTCPHHYCSHGQLDLSRAAFKEFAPMSKGILDLEWSFV
ncbi:hypothetical protein EDD11_005731 [Mortierella claussenii]|nr:hypothetical protein EDD11_005731 [Mortierella claussenii]